MLPQLLTFKNTKHTAGRHLIAFLLALFGTPAARLKNWALSLALFFAFVISHNSFGQATKGETESNTKTKTRLQNMAPTRPLVPMDQLNKEKQLEKKVESETKNESKHLDSNTKSNENATETKTINQEVNKVEHEINPETVSELKDEFKKQIEQIREFVNASDVNRKKYDELKNNLLVDEKQNEPVDIINKLIQVENLTKYIENLQNDMVQKLIPIGESLIKDLNH